MAMQQKAKARPRKKAPATSKGHKHRAAGTKKKTASKKGLLDKIGKKTGTTKKAKDEKPTVTLEGHAEQLLALQVAKAEMAEAKGRVQELEAELLPEMEEHRLGLCESRQKYIRSINVRADGEDEDGDEIKAGQVNYYIQERYTPFNPRTACSDEEITESVGEDATTRDEAIYHICDALTEVRQESGDLEEDDSVSWEEAEAFYEENIEEKDVVTLKEGALEDPAVIEVLQEHLLEWLESTTKAKPTTAFHERSHYDADQRAVMDRLQENGLCKRSKGAVRASGAPKSTKRKATKNA